MAEKTTLADIKEASVKAALEARAAEKSGDVKNDTDREQIFNKHLADAPHRGPKAKQVVGEFLSDLVTSSEGKGVKYGTQFKDLGESSPSTGGYLTPLEFAGTLIELLYKLPVIRPHADVYQMTSDQLEIPVESATVSANWTAELVAITQSDMEFTQVLLQANNLIGISRMSRQLLMDSAINVSLTDKVMQRFAAGIGRAEDSAFMVGSGTGQPKGIRQYTHSHTRAQAGATLAGDDLIDTFHDLPFQYRVQGKDVNWLFNDLTLAKVRKLKDSNGQYLYQDGYGQAFQTPGGTPNLMGKPVLVQNDIPTNLGTGSASEIYIGDLTYYVVGDRETIFSEISTQEGTSFAQHRAAVKTGERLDGKLSTTDAFAQLTAVV